MFARLVALFREAVGEQARLEAEFVQLRQQLAIKTPGNPAAHGHKIYSQTDEDGILAHLFDKLGPGDSTFVEIGCSDGLENNTHALLLKGWRGAWIDADSAKIASLKAGLPPSPRLHVRQDFVTSTNALALLEESLSAISAQGLDFLSVDIDGDDLGVTVALLQGNVKPRVLCVEYNAKFPPPMQVSVDPHRDGGWQGDDYHGASLSALAQALGRCGYDLVCCNVSGINAFFVRSELRGPFPHYSDADLYQPARHRLRNLASGHPASLKFLRDVLSQGAGA